MKKQNIQLLRMIACIMVFTVHFSQRMWFNGTLGKILNQGQYGVYLFFVISGFLIANSCDSYARDNLANYICKRFIKILPLYYGVIVYYFVVHSFVLKDVPADPTGFGWLRYFLILNGVVPKTGMYFWDNLGITWTIPYFIWAYLSIPIILKFVKSYKDSVFLLLAVYFLMNRMHYLGNYFHVAWGMVHFVEGVVVFYSIKEEKKLLTGIGAVLMFIDEFLTSGNPTMLWSYVSVLLILATDHLNFDSGWNKILKISDTYSYTMYLSHGIIFIHVLDRYYLGVLRPVFAIVGTGILTVLINKWIEVPIQKKLMKSLERITS